MKVSSKCPTAAELRDLVEGSGADSSDQSAIVAHLDECTSCQESLEALASGDSSMAITLAAHGAHRAPPPDSAYWSALKSAEQAVTAERPTTPSPLHRRSSSAHGRRREEIVLDFLNPPGDGSHLGSLANFNIVRVIGRGGMGVVLHALDTCLQRDVAIKILDPELSKDELAVTRFCREARAAASISHENVVAVHQVEHDEDKDLPFLVMELISGESLEKKLEREGRLSLKEIVSIGMQTAAGLAAAHAKGLIHRDIKPGNILLEESGLRVKLTDFGLARAAEDVRLTRSGLVAGTPLYMSPEQASGEELDARTDVFSLGVVLYELAAGEPPFAGKTPLAVLKRVAEAEPVPLRQRNPEIPEWFAHIVGRMLAKKPADRFQSAREVADTLEHFWALLKSSETLACPKKKASVRKAVMLGTAAGLLTVALGAAAFVFLAPARDRPEDKIPEPLYVFKSNAGALWSLALSKDGKNLAMGNNNGTVKFWDIAAGKVLWTIPAHKTPIWGLALSPKGDYLATGSDDGQAILWDLKTQEPVRTLANGVGVRAVAFAPDGQRLLTGDRAGGVKVWDVHKGAKLIDKAAPTGLIGAVGYAPDGTTMASAGGDNTVTIWDAATGSPKLTLTGHESGVYGLAFAPNGRSLVTGSWDRTVRLWDLDSGNQLAKLEAHTQDVWSVAFNPEGTLFASAGEDQMVRVWNLATLKEAEVFRGSSGAILSVLFSPQPGLLVAGGKDGTARIWKLSDLKFK